MSVVEVTTNALENATIGDTRAQLRGRLIQPEMPSTSLHGGSTTA